MISAIVLDVPSGNMPEEVGKNRMNALCACRRTNRYLGIGVPPHPYPLPPNRGRGELKESKPQIPLNPPFSKGDLIPSPIDEPPNFSKLIYSLHAPVAQLDRVLDYGSRGWGFKSLRARNSFPKHSDGVAIFQRRPIPLIHRTVPPGALFIPANESLIVSMNNVTPSPYPPFY